MSDERFKWLDMKSLDFTAAPRFRKHSTLIASSVEFAVGGEVVETCFENGSGSIARETVKSAKKGDAIVSRTHLDRYIVDGLTFHKFYELNASERYYVSKNTGAAIFLLENSRINAPWGEVQAIQAGGVIFRSDLSNEVYGNQRASFESDFERLFCNGTSIRLTEDVVRQRLLAEAAHDEAHLKDIELRQEFAERI